MIPTNMYCDGSRSAVIWFKYPGEDWQSFKSYSPPISYQVISEKGQCDVYYDVKGTFKNKTYPAWHPSYCDSQQPWLVTNFRGKILGVQPTQDLRYWVLYNDKNETSLLQVTTDASIFTGKYVFFWDTDECKQSGNRASISSYGAFDPPLIEEIIRLDDQPDDCGKCKFEIFDKNNQIIYSRIEDKCPEIRIECNDKCPDNTHCECICGRYKCCYGKDGNVIKRIKL